MSSVDLTRFEKEKTACFTGHRKIEGITEAELSTEVFDAVCELIGDGYTDFIFGGAIGFDTIAARTTQLIRAMDSYSHIRTHLFLPCKDQDRFWNKEQKAQYQNIISLANSVTYVSEAYTRGVMHKRNAAMVDASSCAISYCTTPQSGGTAYTTRYAYKNGLRVIHIGSQDLSESDFKAPSRSKKKKKPQE